MSKSPRRKRKLTHAERVAIARKAGQSGTGKAKARTPEQASAAAKVRWDRYRAMRAGAAC